MKTTNRTSFEQLLDGTLDLSTKTQDELCRLYDLLDEHGWSLKLEEDAYPTRYLVRVWKAILDAQARIKALQVEPSETPVRVLTTCDSCDKEITSVDDLIHHCMPRPSDPAELCCVLVNCASCTRQEFQLGKGGAIGTPAFLHEQFENGTAAKFGYIWLTI